MTTPEPAAGVTEAEKEILVRMALAGWPAVPQQCWKCGRWKIYYCIDCRFHVPLQCFADLPEVDTGLMSEAFAYITHDSVIDVVFEAERQAKRRP